MGCSGVFLSGRRCTTSAAFLALISAKLSTNTCPDGGSQHMVSYSRIVSIKGSNFPKNHLFRGTLGYPFVPSLRVTRNVLWRLDCYHPLVESYRFILLRWLLLRDVPFYSCPRPNISLCHSIGNGETWMPIFLSNRLAGGAIRLPICSGYSCTARFLVHFLLSCYVFERSNLPGISCINTVFGLRQLRPKIIGS